MNKAIMAKGVKSGKLRYLSGINSHKAVNKCRVCLCGNVAVRWARGDWVCVRCDGIEKALAWSDRKYTSKCKT